jgi:large subunit ribosomal protein L11
MSKKQTVKVMVEGGAASAGPPLGPALGPLGVNTAKVVAEINNVTASFKGMKIPVNVIIDPETKNFELEIGSPPTSALLIKAAGLEKGGGETGTAADISLEQVIEIAKNKKTSLLAKDIKAAIKEVIGACQSLKFSIQGLTPKEMTAEINSGKLDDYINGKTTELPTMVHKEEKIELVSEFEPKEKKPKKEDETPDKEAKPGEKPPAEDKKGKK